MKKIISLLFLANIFVAANCQKDQFMLVRPSLNTIDSIEKNNNGEKFEFSFSIKVSKDYFPGADKFNLANPFVYFRKHEIFSLEMNYFYSIPDSIVRLISYSWGGSQKSSSQLSSLFEENSVYFNKYFGTNGEFKSEKHEDWEQKSLTWQNDLVHVHQFFVSGQTTNRVRVLISWK